MIEDTETPVPQSIRWSECYSGGSAEAELAEFQQLAHAIMAVQTATRKKISSHDAPHPIQRAFHAKATLAVDDAVLRFGRTASRTCRSAPRCRARPTRRPCASRTPQVVAHPTLPATCAASRCAIQISDTESIDLLATNYPVSHARNARQFVEFATRHRGWPNLAASRDCATGQSSWPRRNRAHVQKRQRRPQTAGGQCR